MQKDIHQGSLSRLLTTVGRFGLALLAISVGLPAGQAAANTRPLTLRNPAAPLPLTYTTNATERAECLPLMQVLQATPESFAPYRHTTLTGCREPVAADGHCAKPLGQRRKDGSIRLQEAIKTKYSIERDQKTKFKENANTLIAALSCEEISKTLDPKIDYKKDPEGYKKAMAAAVLKIAKERNLKIDGVPLVIEEGDNEVDALCMMPDDRRKGHDAPRVVIVIDPKNCTVQGMHPMLKKVKCFDVCAESIDLARKYKNP